MNGITSRSTWQRHCRHADCCAIVTPTSARRALQGDRERGAPARGAVFRRCAFDPRLERAARENGRGAFDRKLQLLVHARGPAAPRSRP